MKYNIKKKFGEGKQSSGGEQKRQIVMHLKEVLFPYFICQTIKHLMKTYHESSTVIGTGYVDRGGNT